MCARVGCVFAALLVAALAVVAARAQDAQILIDVREQPDHAELNLPAQAQAGGPRGLAGLAHQLDGVKADILLLYTEYTGQAGSDLKNFLRGIAEYAAEAVEAVPGTPDALDHGDCRELYERHLRKMKLDAYRAASFSGENHHKFLLGHMVVFRMHINKTNEYLKKYDMALRRCGTACETKPKIRRWKRLAAGELHRINDDIQHTRRSYKDLVLHARRRLQRLKKHLEVEATEATVTYQQCLANTTRV